MLKRVAMLGAFVLVPALLRAQARDASRGEVAGTVYDSVARSAIVGAIVQMVSAADPSRPVYSATTDARGRYLITGVEPGRYVAGFFHAALDSLALNSPLRAFNVVAGKRASVDLAVPAPATIATAFCGHSGRADSTGVLIGVLADARTRRPLDSGEVQARWHEFVLDSTGFNQFDRVATDTVQAGGWFVLCGVPALSEVAVRGWKEADSTGLVLVTVPFAGVTRRDLFMRGTSTVRGTVLSERRRPIPNARVGPVGRERVAVTDSSGAFFLGDIPAGTQTLEVRALGYAPDYRPVYLRADGDTILAVTLTSTKKVLDTIRVFAQRVFDRELQGFDRRRRAGGGYFFDADDIRRRGAYDLFSFLWQVPSLRVVHRGFERTIMMRSGADLCTPQLVLNGMRMPGDLITDLDLLARPDEVVGLEVYRGTQAPPEFSSFNTCGAIVVWTRTPTRVKR
ncbi:MAG: carboxypeptidase-like regulatory domain-containing protein [Gemmatimonadaceae bacterium]